MKVKIHDKEKKAMVRFNHPAEIEWFKRHMAFIRDSDPKTHPPMVLKDENGTVRFPKPKPMPKMAASSGQVAIPPKDGSNIQKVMLDPKKIKNVQVMPLKPKKE